MSAAKGVKQEDGMKSTFFSVLSNCFKMYPGFILIRCGKVADEETITLKEKFVIYRSQEVRTCYTAHGAMLGSPGVPQETKPRPER